MKCGLKRGCLANDAFAYELEVLLHAPVYSYRDLHWMQAAVVLRRRSLDRPSGARGFKMTSALLDFNAGRLEDCIMLAIPVRVGNRALPLQLPEPQ